MSYSRPWLSNKVNQFLTHHAARINALTLNQLDAELRVLNPLSASSAIYQVKAFFLLLLSLRV